MEVRLAGSMAKQGDRKPRKKEDPRLMGPWQERSDGGAFSRLARKHLKNNPSLDSLGRIPCNQ